MTLGKYQWPKMLSLEGHISYYLIDDTSLWLISAPLPSRLDWLAYTESDE